MQNQEWRELIAGQWQWSAGLDALIAYWARHGCGLTAANSTLRFANGALEALTLQGEPAIPVCRLAVAVLLMGHSTATNRCRHGIDIFNAVRRCQSALQVESD